MRSLLRFIILALILFAVSCGGNQIPPTPMDTFKAYTLAFKQKDTTTMKLLLSESSLKMAEQQAAQQGVTVDDIVKNETLFTESQKDIFFRNEKVEGDRATIEVKNGFGSWDVVPFIREEGIWKIDKQGIATQIQQKNDINNKRLDDLINNPNPQDSSVNPTMPQNNQVNPTNPQDFSISPNMPQTKDSQTKDSIDPTVAPSIITNQTINP